MTMGWKPESGFLPYRWEGYDEALILYILGLGLPTHPLSKDSYTAWTATYEWKSSYGYEYLYAGSLFIHQLSHIWIDVRGSCDAFMRATHVQQQYAIYNSLKFEGYSKYCWELTASNGPGQEMLTVKGF